MPPLQLFYLDNTKKNEHISDLTDKRKRRGLERSREALARRVNCSKILPVALSGPEWALWRKMVNCPLDPVSVVILQVARTEASWSTFFEHMVKRRVDCGSFPGCPLILRHCTEMGGKRPWSLGFRSSSLLGFPRVGSLWSREQPFLLRLATLWWPHPLHPFTPDKGSQPVYWKCGPFSLRDGGGAQVICRGTVSVLVSTSPT